MRQDKPGLSPLGHSLRLAAALRCPLSIDKRTSREGSIGGLVEPEVRFRESGPRVTAMPDLIADLTVELARAFGTPALEAFQSTHLVVIR